MIFLSLWKNPLRIPSLVISGAFQEGKLLLFYFAFSETRGAYSPHPLGGRLRELGDDDAAASLLRAQSREANFIPRRARTDAITKMKMEAEVFPSARLCHV